LVKEFARQGHDVTLLTVKDDEYHIHFEEEYGVTIKDLGQPKMPKIILNGRNNISHLIKRVFRRGLYQLFEYPDIELMYQVKKALRHETGYDLLISIAVPHPIHWGVSWAWREDHPIAKIWVADCGDPYMGSTLDSFNKMPYFKFFEKSFCRKADFITVPIEEAKEGYYREFRDKIEVIPQGFNFEEIEVGPSKYVGNKVPTFAYAGGFIPGGRDPRPFLEYLTTLTLEYEFIIFTKNSDLVKPYLKKADGKIEVRDYIPRDQLLQFLATMDFLVNFENESSLMMPSKLIDYHLTGRPVLSIRSKSTDIPEETVIQFLNGDYTNQHRLPNIDRHKIKNVCQNFLELCKVEHLVLTNERL
jgi:hypothetical protein